MFSNSKTADNINITARIQHFRNAELCKAQLKLCNTSINMHIEELRTCKPFTELVSKSCIIAIMQKWNFHFHLLDQTGLVHMELKSAFSAF